MFMNEFTCIILKLTFVKRSVKVDVIFILRNKIIEVFITLHKINKKCNN